MIIHQVAMKLKDDSAPEFTRIIEKNVSQLSKQAGFRDSVAFVSSERSEAISYTFWNTNEEAEAYHEAGYLELLNALSKVIEGTPQVQNFSLSNSTFHKVDAMRV
jgi:heme-degrading monooxygenase HmoA